MVKDGSVTKIGRQAVQMFFELKDFLKKDNKRRLFDIIKQENS